MAYAEVIGDPIAHSKSPAIHHFWLKALGISADYRATRVTDLAAYVADRRTDPDWLGCNITAPHKQAIIPFLDESDRIGAVNCVRPENGRLIGRNTDVDGIDEALAGADLSRTVLIGRGGAAIAALAWLAGRGSVAVLTRETVVHGDALAGATLLINATPLGMAHAPAMPAGLLAALGMMAPGATVLDMVYQPLDTPLLRAARAAGFRSVDGLAMLIGQARRAFTLFFGAEPPAQHDRALKHSLIAGTGTV